MKRTSTSVLFVVSAIAFSFLLLEMPTIVNTTLRNKTSIAARYPLRARTPSFFERTKASYNQSKKTPSGMVK